MEGEEEEQETDGVFHNNSSIHLVFDWLLVFDIYFTLLITTFEERRHRPPPSLCQTQHLSVA